ncbi:MAG: histidine kinase [Treponema sp.]|nr:histidine kinase [Treponema sp.]
MKTHEKFEGGSGRGIKSFLLKILGGYRIICLPAIFVIVFYSGKDSGANNLPLVFLWLSLSAVLYFFLFRSANFFILLLSDYFVVLLYSYFEPSFLIAEFIWIPGILVALALAVPAPAGKILSLGLGILGAIVFSWGYTSGLAIFAAGIAVPFYLAALIIYVPVGLLAFVVSFIGSEMEKIRNRNAGLETVNARLNELNRGVSEKIFRLQNDTALEARKRLSKEIHDSTGYVFINLIMMLQAASAVSKKDAGKAQKLVDDARDYAERGINEIRHLLRDFRSYTTSRVSLQNEFFSLVESFHKATEVEIRMDYGEWPSTISKETDSFFISFLQETLTNALKHGHATEISVVCWKSVSHIGMSVTDNGTGAEMPIKFGIGITAMEDSIGQMQGAIYIRNDEPGFRISASIPLEAVRTG